MGQLVPGYSLQLSSHALVDYAANKEGLEWNETDYVTAKHIGLPSQLPGGPHAPTPYAFIRWFKRAPLRGDQLEAAGCVRLTYEAPLRGTQGVHEIIHLSSIVCRHHVVPDFKAKSTFYVSAFSPCRPV